MNFEQELEERWNNERNNLKNPDYYAVVKAGLAVCDNVDGVISVDVDFNELEPTTGRYTFTFAPNLAGYNKKKCMSRIDTIVKELCKNKPFDADGTLYMSGVSWYFLKYVKCWKCAFRIKMGK